MNSRALQVLAAALALALVCVPANGELPKDADYIFTKYQEALTKANQPLIDLLKKYEQALKKQSFDFRAKNDSAALAAVEAEMAKIEKNEPITADSSIDSIRQLQDFYLKARARTMRKTVSDSITIIKSASAKLDTLQAKYLREGDIQNGIEIKNVIESMDERLRFFESVKIPGEEEKKDSEKKPEKAE